MMNSKHGKFLEPDTENDEYKYQTIIEYCRQHDTVFHDGEFPHTNENLGKRILRMTEFQEMKMKTVLKSHKVDFLLHKFEKKTDIIWKRPNPSENGSKLDFWCPAHPFEVNQNGLSNCGLIAVLSAISTKKPLLRQIFPDMKLSEYGVYQVKLCIDGEWKTIVVDDWFPCVRGESRGAKSDFKCYQIWPSLIEKAFAKVYGSYDRLHRFDMDSAFLNMTGAPICIRLWKEQISESESKTLWNMMYEAQLRFTVRKRKRSDILVFSLDHLLMTCGSSKGKKVYSSNVEKLKEPKLSRAHCFTIVKVREYKSHRLIRLRNPWGDVCWTGKWSPSWSGWDDEGILELVSNERNICGTFWIEFDDFLKYFDSVTICLWRSSWNEIRVNMTIGGLWDDSQKVIRITVPKTCQLCVSAFKPGYENYEYFTWVSIHETDEKDSEEIGEIVMFELIRYSSKDVTLLPGNYLILVSKDIGSKQKRNVAIHSSLPIHAKICSWSPKMLIEVFHRMTSEYGREIIKHRNDISIKKLSKDNEFMIVMAQNYSYKKHLHVHIRFPRTKKDQYSRGGTHDYNIGDVIPPRSSQILLHCQQSPRKGFPMTIEYYLSEETTMKIRREERAAHIPAIGAADYIHHTVSLE